MGDLKFRVPLDLEKEGINKGKLFTNRRYGKKIHPIKNVEKFHLRSS